MSRSCVSSLHHRLRSLSQHRRPHGQDRLDRIRHRLSGEHNGYYYPLPFQLHLDSSTLPFHTIPHYSGPGPPPCFSPRTLPGSTESPVLSGEFSDSSAAQLHTSTSTWLTSSPLSQQVRFRRDNPGAPFRSTRHFPQGRRAIRSHYVRDCQGALGQDGSPYFPLLRVLRKHHRYLGKLF